MKTSRIAPPEERFRRRVQVDTGGCWIWLGAPDRDGYGRIKVQGRMVRAHRYSWQLHRGDIPAGLELDHLCRNPACVNPEHLEPVTHAENVRRGMAPTAINARKTRCPEGHEYDGVNSLGSRTCSVCITARRSA